MLERASPEARRFLKGKIMRTRVGIVGATGYTGLELMRLLVRHPEVEITALTSQKYAGMSIDRVFPSLARQVQIRCEELSVERISEKTDFIFTAVPHKTAMETVPLFYRAGKKVVDLSADFRLKDVAAYERWYQKHTSPELLSESVYGLPELHRDSIRRAGIVGNPGCYPTGALLGLIPLVKEKAISTDAIVIDSKSGVSGAGRDVALDSLFCEVNEGVKAYKLFNHRHLPEIEGELSELAGKTLRVTFIPHLIPMDRGILSTIYVTLTRKMNTDDALALFQSYYQGAPFVRICPKEALPSTRHVKGSNFCDIGLKVRDEDGRMVVVTAIDNLVKGASGQAVHNMNLMLGLPETMGLEIVPLTP
jgi:N-acetyl-gamma-glutamyl-phosphate reductase